jgi:hypothetical protein
MGDKKRSGGWWWVKALLWVCVLGGAAGAAWWSLNERAHPWEVIFRLPGGRIDRGRARKAIAISPDGKWLAIARPSGVLQIRDMETFALHSVLGDPNTPNDPHKMPYRIHWLADSQRVLFDFLDGGPRTFTLDGNEISIPRINDKPVSVVRTNPRNNTALVYVNTSTFFLMNLSTAEATPIPWDVLNWDQYEERGTYQWASDGRRMLLQTNDYVRLRDMQDGNDLWAHYLLNLRLPPPHIMSGPAAKPEYSREAPWDANHPWYTVCKPVQAAFVLDEKYVAAIYEPIYAGTFFCYDDPDRHGYRLRLYDANSGELIWDHVLGEWADMFVSSDGRRVYLIFREPGVAGRTHRFEAWNLETRQRLDERTYSPYEDGFVPFFVEDFPDGRWVALYGGYAWLVDTQRELPDIPLRVDYGTAVMFTAADGQRIIQMGDEGQMTIWQKRRDVHPLGVWALWEPYALCPMLLALTVGLVVIAGREGSRRLGRPLPKAMWVACVTIAIGLGYRMAIELLGYVIDPLTQMDCEPVGWGTLTWFWGLALFVAAAMTGTARLRRGWWKALLAYQIIMGAAIAMTIPSAWGPMDYPTVWQQEISIFSLPAWAILLLSIGAACLFGLQLVLLLWPSTREAIRSRSGVPFIERAKAARTRINSLLGYDPAWSPEREETG